MAEGRALNMVGGVNDQGGREGTGHGGGRGH